MIIVTFGSSGGIQPVRRNFFREDLPFDDADRPLLKGPDINTGAASLHHDMSDLPLATIADTFDHAIALEPAGQGLVRGHTHPEWTNMVGPFGGITAAAFLNAAVTHPDRLGDPVALTVNFATAIADGEFCINVRPVRTNRSTQHWTFELSQHNEITATATAVFAIRRDTWAETEAAPVTARAPETLEPAEYPAVLWARQYDKRFVEGEFPVDGEPRATSTSTLWVRDLAGRPLDYPGLAALSDVFFPRIFLRRGGLKPAGTVSLTTHFHADQAQLEAVGNDFVLCTAHANRFVGGFFDQSAELWSRAGHLLATSHQTVYFKA